ncbi:inorganic pyrophosphatase, partial [Phenoliferia sp. Uapishka_3]
MATYTTREVAALNTLDYRCFIEQDGKVVSPFHDIPLFANEARTILNVSDLNEPFPASLSANFLLPRPTSTHTALHIPSRNQHAHHELDVSHRWSLRSPGSWARQITRGAETNDVLEPANRWSNAKMEISKSEHFNPILQDTKKGKLRFVRNCFPHKGYIWNYGFVSRAPPFPLLMTLINVRSTHFFSAFPQTWEDPNAMHPETKANGDDDPVDVCEIGEAIGYVGQVKQVKVLGIMALLDEGETDWKVIVVDVNDPLASKLNDIEDVERHLPGLIRATNEWFRIYKIPDGKPENQFAFSGEAKNRKYATEIIHECNEAWKRLMSGQAKAGEISLANVAVDGTLGKVAVAEGIPAGQKLAPAPIDPSINKTFFISGHAVRQHYPESVIWETDPNPYHRSRSLLDENTEGRNTCNSLAYLVPDGALVSRLNFWPSVPTSFGTFSFSTVDEPKGLSRRGGRGSKLTDRTDSNPLQQVILDHSSSVSTPFPNMAALPLDLLPLILSQLFNSCTTPSEQDANLQSIKFVSQAWLHASRHFDFYYVTSFRQLESLRLLLHQTRNTRGHPIPRKRLVLARWNSASVDDLEAQLGLGGHEDPSWVYECLEEGVLRARIGLLTELDGLEELMIERVTDGVQTPTGPLEGVQSLRSFATVDSPHYYVDLLVSLPKMSLRLTGLMRYDDSGDVMNWDAPRLESIECRAARISRLDFAAKELKVLRVGRFYIPYDTDPTASLPPLDPLLLLLSSSHQSLHTLNIREFEHAFKTSEILKLISPLSSLVELHIPVPTPSTDLSDDDFWLQLSDALPSLHRLSLTGTRGIISLFDTLSLVSSQRHLRPPPLAFPLLEIVQTHPYSENGWTTKPHAAELKGILAHVVKSLRSRNFETLRPRWVIVGKVRQDVESYIHQQKSMLGKRYGVALERR